jgi:hypothetical protein
MANPNFAIREYNPITGAVISDNVKVLRFTANPGGHTQVKVLDIKFSNVEAVSDIKIGIVASGDLVVNESPENIADDGSASNGKFGIETSSVFDSQKASSQLFRHFAGVNTDGLSSNDKNVEIGNRGTLISNYIYIDIEIGAVDTKAINGGYKLFYDYY